MPSRLSHLECARCARTHDSERLVNRCGCGGTLLARYELDGVDLARCRARPPDAWRFRELLPVRGAPVSLGEPRTALLPVARLGQRWGVDALVKDDATLPGGTFKARGASVGLSRAHELGATTVVMPSAGNAGGAWSLYAARAGMRITVTMARTAPVANHTEVRIAGGELELVDGTIADASRRAGDIARDRGAYLTATFAEPYRLEGKKAAWLEVFDQLGGDDGMRLPGTVVLPVGGGVAALALAKAAEEVRALGWTDDPPPAIVGVQPETCAPVVRAFERGEEAVAPWDGACDTIAAGLRVPAPSEGAFVLRVVRASGGAMVAVSEDEIRAAVRDLATFEGVFACPEGAAAAAATAKLAPSGGLRAPVVVYNTGAGAKYVDVLG